MTNPIYKTHQYGEWNIRVYKTKEDGFVRHHAIGSRIEYLASQNPGIGVEAFGKICDQGTNYFCTEYAVGRGSAARALRYAKATIDKLENVVK
jgi:hypothetical protein